MSYLLDTNVVSETRKRRPDPRVVAWLGDAVPNALHLSVLTLGELATGIARLGRSDPDSATDLARWLDGLDTLFADRILPVDAAVARAWGALGAERDRPVIDTLLAATARVHGLAVVTRNSADFAIPGLAVVDPWTGA